MTPSDYGLSTPSSTRSTSTTPDVGRRFLRSKILISALVIGYNWIFLVVFHHRVAANTGDIEKIVPFGSQPQQQGGSNLVVPPHTTTPQQQDAPPRHRRKGALDEANEKYRAQSRFQPQPPSPSPPLPDDDGSLSASPNHGEELLEGAISGFELTEEMKARMKASPDEDEARSQGGKLFKDLMAHKEKRKQQGGGGVIPKPTTSMIHSQASYPQPVQQQHQALPPPLPPQPIGNLLAGISRIDRTAFLRSLDHGYGIEESSTGNSDVLLLHLSHRSLPPSGGNYSSLVNDGEVFPHLDEKEATANCEVLKTVTVNPDIPTLRKHRKKMPPPTCLAVVGNWESYNVAKWKRKVDKGSSGLFQPVQSWSSTVLPTAEQTEAAQRSLLKYLGAFADARDRVRRLLVSHIGPPKDPKTTTPRGRGNPVVVMVGNIGQARYLINFLCACRVRGFNLSDRLLLFATDVDMYRLAQSLNVTVFYEADIFRTIPRDAAVDYKDPNFGLIMLSKVYSVHLVNSLGYDLLFQDLDLVWYTDPLHYFADETSSGGGQKKAPPDFDIYFQHDGYHRPDRFAPMAANTGFYYVRYNDRTRHFFDVFSRMGDLVIANGSHQAAMSTLINEHASRHNLRVKVLADDNNLFLSGFHYHARKPLMRRVREGRHMPIIFHANWLKGKDKEPVLREMRNWYINDNCTAATLASVTPTVPAGEAIYGDCCRADLPTD